MSIEHDNVDNRENSPPTTEAAVDPVAVDPVEENTGPDPRIGAIEWIDLTVHNADSTGDFYAAVIGWEKQEVPMGSYSDFNICQPKGKEPIAGICHARGPNSNVPAQWLMYVRVEDVKASAETCKRRGGKILDGPKRNGGQDICIIEDPEGAVLAIFTDRS